MGLIDTPPLQCFKSIPCFHYLILSHFTECACFFFFFHKYIITFSYFKPDELHDLGGTGHPHTHAFSNACRAI